MENLDIHTYRLAEYVWPLSTYIDHLGERHSLRKYLYLGGIGVINVKSNTVIVSPKSEYRKMFIDPYYESIVVGCYDNDELNWKIFSLSGEPLFADSYIQTLEEVTEKLVEYRKSWEQ